MKEPRTHTPETSQVTFRDLSKVAPDMRDPQTPTPETSLGTFRGLKVGLDMMMGTIIETLKRCSREEQHMMMGTITGNL